MSSIKVAIISDDVSMREGIKSYFSATGGISVVLESDDAEGVMDNFESLGVEVVITQVLMAGINVFDMMERFVGKDYCPKFIVISELKSEVFMCRCFAGGASAYLLKPLNMKQLEIKVRNVCGKSNEINRVVKNANQVVTDKSLDEKLATIFVSIGIPPHIKGYQFLRDGIKFVVEDPTIINAITRELYPNIAKKHDTTPSKVERAIRHAIEVAWSRGKIDNINNLFGVKVYSANEKPTNGEFIALIADKMLLEGA